MLTERVLYRFTTLAASWVVTVAATVSTRFVLWVTSRAAEQVFGVHVDSMASVISFLIGATCGLALLLELDW